MEEPDYAWYQSPTFSVPSHTWTPVAWTLLGVDLLGLSIAPDGEVTPPAGFLYDLDIEIAWQNIHGLAPHRRKVRYRHGPYPWVSSDINSAVTNGSKDDQTPQTQTVNMQPNDVPFYIEVWHNAGQPIDCMRFGVEAPSLMIAKLGVIS